MGQIYLALYQKQHWSRSLLPSLARYMRSHTDHYLHTISGENELELLSKPYNQPAGFIGVFNESKQELVGILKAKGCIRMRRDESLTVATLAEQLHVLRQVGPVGPVGPVPNEIRR